MGRVTSAAGNPNILIQRVFHRSLKQFEAERESRVSNNGSFKKGKSLMLEGSKIPMDQRIEAERRI